MRLIYAPKGEEQRTYEFDTETLSGPEAELVEDAGGLKWETYGEWVGQFFRGGWRATKVALWVCIRRDNEKLGFEELANLAPSDLLVDYTTDEEDAGKDSEGEDATEPDDSPTASASPTPDSGPSPNN